MSYSCSSTDRYDANFSSKAFLTILSLALRAVLFALDNEHLTISGTNIFSGMGWNEWDCPHGPGLLVILPRFAVRSVERDLCSQSANRQLMEWGESDPCRVPFFFEWTK